MEPRADAAVVAPLVQAGWRVLVPDLVGFGRSDKPKKNTVHPIALLQKWAQALNVSPQHTTLWIQDWEFPDNVVDVAKTLATIVVRLENAPHCRAVNPEIDPAYQAPFPDKGHRALWNTFNSSKKAMGVVWEVFICPPTPSPPA